MTKNTTQENDGTQSNKAANFDDWGVSAQAMAAAAHFCTAWPPGRQRIGKWVTGRRSDRALVASGFWTQLVEILSHKEDLVALLRLFELLEEGGDYFPKEAVLQQCLNAVESQGPQKNIKLESYLAELTEQLALQKAFALTWVADFFGDGSKQWCAEKSLNTSKNDPAQAAHWRHVVALLLDGHQQHPQQLRSFLLSAVSDQENPLNIQTLQQWLQLIGPEMDQVLDQLTVLRIFSRVSIVLENPHLTSEDKTAAARVLDCVKFSSVLGTPRLAEALLQAIENTQNLDERTLLLRVFEEFPWSKNCSKASFPRLVGALQSGQVDILPAFLMMMKQSPLTLLWMALEPIETLIEHDEPRFGVGTTLPPEDFLASSKSGKRSSSRTTYDLCCVAHRALSNELKSRQTFWRRIVGGIGGGGANGPAQSFMLPARPAPWGGRGPLAFPPSFPGARTRPLGQPPRRSLAHTTTTRSAQLWQMLPPRQKPPVPPQAPKNLQGRAGLFFAVVAGLGFFALAASRGQESKTSSLSNVGAKP